MQHGQIVVGLGQFGVELRELGEGLDGLVGLAQIALSDAAQEHQLRIARSRFDALVDRDQCLLGFLLLEQGGDAGVVFRMSP